MRQPDAVAWHTYLRDNRRAVEAYRQEYHCPHCGALTYPMLNRRPRLCDGCRKDKP